MRRLISAVFLFSGLIVIALATTACEKKATQGYGQPETKTDQMESDEQNKAQPEQDATQKGARKETTGGTNGEARTITIKPVDNQMKYATTELTVQPGEKIHLVFNNTATSAAMKHNVVVLTTNEPNVAMEIAQAGWKLPEQEYVPEHEAILAYTEMSDPGETVDVTFTAPKEPGKYMFICTFPGHYPTMKGTLIVEKK